MQEVPSAPYAISFAILFGYNGSEFDGLERTKGQKSIESILLSTVGSVVGEKLDSSVNISMINISRASITEVGEHSSRQTISLEISGSPNLKVPSEVELNAKLPESIHVFKVVEMPQGFSARRTCEGRTFEFVFPTYVLAPPPEGTMYSNPSISDEDEDFAYPTDMVIEAPAGGMFKTMMRGKTDSISVKGNNVSKETMVSPIQEKPRKMGFAQWFSKLLFGKKVPEKIRKQGEMHLAAQRGQSLSRRTLHRKDAPAIPMEMPIKKDEKTNLSHVSSVEDDNAFTGMGGFFSTLKRTMSTKRRKVAFKDDASSDMTVTEDMRSFDPLDIPWDEAYLSNLSSYRITESQIKSLKNIISLYYGTHNWHNYIPGASANDSRCYLRILNVELAAPEMHEGLEWVRIKIQAKAFARYQIRKMIALAIMVIRTNTPVAVIGNSFGYAKIELPEVPALGLILDEPQYTEYNDYASRTNNALIDFEAIKDEVENFRKTMIHNKIYSHEAKNMEFAKWIRELDMHSFLYTYFLNHRGVIDRRNRNAVKK